MLTKQQFTTYLHQIGYETDKAPAIKAIKKAAADEDMAFEDYVIATARSDLFGPPLEKKAGPRLVSAFPQAMKTEKTLLAENILKSGWDLDWPGNKETTEKSRRYLKAQLYSNEGPTDHKETNNWWAMIRARYAEWQVDQEEGS